MTRGVRMIRTSNGFGVVEAIRLAALRPWPDENGRYSAARTLEDYWYAWKSGGFAALQPKSRGDEGAFRKLPTEVGQWLLSEVSQYPEIPLKVLYERWTQAGQQLPSLRTNGRPLAALSGTQGLLPSLHHPSLLDRDRTAGALFTKTRQSPQTPAQHQPEIARRSFHRTGPHIPVLLLDEAQNYAMSALEEMRMLLGLNLPEQPTFALILVGDPYLLSVLRLRSHRALYSRIAAHARVEGLSRAEVEPYLEHQLRQVGIERPCFEPAAVELLASASEGIPRIINLVARAAWIQAAKDKSLQISATHLQSALELVPGVMEIRENPSHP